VSDRAGTFSLGVGQLIECRSQNSQVLRSPRLAIALFNAQLSYEVGHAYLSLFGYTGGSI
jgi:hypothetical protein